MRIVYLDSHVLNPGDLDWQGLDKIGDCVFHDRTPPGEVVARSRDAEIVLTNKVVFNKAIMEALPRLRYIGVTATGYNIVDIEAAKTRGILVTNVPAYSTEAVAQSVFALMLELTNHIGHHDRTVHEGRWNASRDFCYWEKPIIELSGLTIGLVGFGHIGQAVARIAHAFGMKVLAHTRTPRPAAGAPVEFCALDDLFARADIVSLHCPLTPETQGFVDARRLGLMKPAAFLINTARGPLIDEAALTFALDSGRIAGAALDVLSTEPPSGNNPLLKAKNCILTPHIAWASVAARKRLLTITIENLRTFFAGQPANVVNG